MTLNDNAITGHEFRISKPAFTFPPNSTKHVKAVKDAGNDVFSNVFISKGYTKANKQRTLPLLTIKEGLFLVELCRNTIKHQLSSPISFYC